MNVSGGNHFPLGDPLIFWQI